MRRVLLLFLLGAGLGCDAAWAEHQWIPNAKELFPPLRADPRELQYSAVLRTPVSHQVIGEAALGDLIGLYRRELVPGVPIQISGGGGVFARFDLASTTNDLQVVDFYANIPIDLRHGPWSYRMLLYHTSSHLGDDYIKRTGDAGQKHSFDNLKWLASYNARDRWRVYGGPIYVFRTLPKDERIALQGGFEVQSAWRKGALFYWANDFQSWQRNHWNPSFNSQIGVTFARSPQSAQSVTFYTQFSAGVLPQGQFYKRKETSWSWGVRLSLS